MKKLLTLLLVVLSIGYAAGEVFSCQPPTGFDWCYGNEFVYGRAHAVAHIYGTNTQFDFRQGNLVVGDAFVEVGFVGDELFVLTDWPETEPFPWDACNAIGCGFDDLEPGRYVLASRTVTPNYPMFVAWDFDQSSVSEDWAWTAVGGGWFDGTWLDNYTFVECVLDEHCPVGEFCDRTGTYTCTTAPHQMNFDRAREYTFNPPFTVWQFFAEFNTWYVYHHDDLGASNLVLTADDWNWVLQDQGIPFCGDGVCDVEIGEDSVECPEDCPSQQLCGNNICEEPFEDSVICSEDCFCGNNVCEVSESFLTCGVDCGGVVCGDGVCQPPETEFSCPDDCLVPGDCPNGVCDVGETNAICPSDCTDPFCGNVVCELGEEFFSCPSDCESPPSGCGDGVCELDETPDNCPEDCGVCGNLVCEDGETQLNCPIDCGLPPVVCGNDICEVGEDSQNCPQDCEPVPPLFPIELIVLGVIGLVTLVAVFFILKK